MMNLEQLSIRYMPMLLRGRAIVKYFSFQHFAEGIAGNFSTSQSFNQAVEKTKARGESQTKPQLARMPTLKVKQRPLRKLMVKILPKALTTAKDQMANRTIIIL